MMRNGDLLAIAVTMQNLLRLASTCSSLLSFWCSALLQAHVPQLSSVG